MVGVWLAVTYVWTSSAIEDSVPTGVVNNVATSQIVKCDSALSGNAGPSGAVPTLPEGRAYGRAACDLPHHNFRLMFEIDVALGIAAVLGLVFIHGADRQPSSAEDTKGLLVGATRA